MYKNIVFYFTGTGNSLKIAKDIGNIIGDCKIVSMSAYNQNDNLDDYEKIGFVCPVYGMSIPHFVKEFISKSNFPQNKYYFCVVNYSDYHGASIAVMNKLLNKKSIRLNAAFFIKMVSNYIVLKETPENYNEVLEKAQVKINNIGQKIKDMENKNVIKHHPLMVFSNFGYKLYKTLDRYFNVSNECIGCGNCYKICPVKNIIMENNRPKFKNNCEQCVACINSCPKRAINFLKVTNNRKRYINPNIRIEEIVNGNK
jgi:ferredoxin